MFSNFELSTLQEIWWVLTSLLGATFLFLTFVQGGQTLLLQVGKTEVEKSLIVNSLGRKWEITFSTLVVFGGALFAAFPKFYATSFGGAYWVWILILFSFIIQAVSYEYRKKPDNALGQKTYEIFLFINGFLSVLLIGAAVGTFFTGSSFVISEYGFVTWMHPLRGLEAAFNLFNLSLGLFLVFNARTLGAMYLINNIDFSTTRELEKRLRKESLINFIVSLPFLLYVLVNILFMDGFGVDASGTVAMIEHKYLDNLITNPVNLILLLTGLVLVILGVFYTSQKQKTNGIFYAGFGTVFVGLTIFFLAAYNGTAFYPSTYDLQSSLTIYNASSTQYTLAVMLVVALALPVVLAYIVYVWRVMDNKKISEKDLESHEAY